MALKPDKYKQKYCLAVDEDSKYLVNGFPYLGKDETRPTNKRVADHIVMQLFLNKERNATTDNYFISVKLATQLRQNQTNLLGTVNKIRRKVPLSPRKKKEELYSSKLYKFGNITLTLHQGKANKNVLILCTMHKDIKISDNPRKIPKTVSCYNETKYGVEREREFI